MAFDPLDQHLPALESLSNSNDYSIEASQSAFKTVVSFVDESKKLLSWRAGQAEFSPADMQRFRVCHEGFANSFMRAATELTDVSFDRPVFSSSPLPPPSVSSSRCFLPFGSVHVALPRDCECRMVSALLYLLMCDAVKGFELPADGRVEVPCLIEYFTNSTSNNQTNIGALLGEYVMCIKICSHKQLFTDDISTCYCQTRESPFDFHTVHNGEVTDFSVKSVDFTSDRLSVDLKCKEDPDNENAENIVLHNCCCTKCHSGCVETVKLRKPNGGVAGMWKECENKSKKMDVLNGARRGSYVIHFVPAPFLFEIRRALNCVNQKELRQCDRNFPLRKEIVSKMKQQRPQPSDPENVRMKLLVRRDRSS